MVPFAGIWSWFGDRCMPGGKIRNADRPRLQKAGPESAIPGDALEDEDMDDALHKL